MVNTIRSLPHWDGQAQKTQVTIGNVKGKKFPWQQRERLWYLWAWNHEDRKRLHGFASQSCTLWIGLPLKYLSTMMKPSNLFNLNFKHNFFFICSVMSTVMLDNGMTHCYNHISQRVLYVLQTQCPAEAFATGFISSVWNPALDPQSLCSITNNHGQFKYSCIRWLQCVGIYLPFCTLNGTPLDMLSLFQKWKCF